MKQGRSASAIPAVQALRDLFRPQWSQTSLAKALAQAARKSGIEDLEVSQTCISRWVCGTARPRPHLRRLLEQVAGIPADSWMSAAERRAAERERQARPTRRRKAA